MLALQFGVAFDIVNFGCLESSVVGDDGKIAVSGEKERESEKCGDFLTFRVCQSVA